MTTSFQPYEFKELAQKKPESKVTKFESPNFVAHPSQTVAKVSIQKTPNFRLDQTVAVQLGIEEQERASAEIRITTEIERRWEIAKEKAEVEGYTAGLEEGKKEAFKAALPRIEEKMSRMEHILQDWDQMRERIFLGNEGFLMDLLAQISKMVLLREVAIDPEYIHRVVMALLAQLGNKDNIKIFLSPEDTQTVEELKTCVEKEFGKLNNVSFELGRNLTPGSCKIETRFGVVDASLQAQVDNVMKALRS